MTGTCAIGGCRESQILRRPSETRVMHARVWAQLSYKRPSWCSWHGNVGLRGRWIAILRKSVLPRNPKSSDGWQK